MNPKTIWVFLVEVEVLPPNPAFKVNRSNFKTATIYAKGGTKEEAKKRAMEYCASVHIKTHMLRATANAQSDCDLSNKNLIAMLELADRFGVAISQTDGLPPPPNN